MAFSDFPEQKRVVQLLRRSLQRGRLAHAYLFVGATMTELEAVARTLAKTLNCASPPKRADNQPALDSCDACNTCGRIDNENHPDVFWVRPESKSRVIVLGQMREVMQSLNLKPTEAEFKVAVIAGADRLNAQAANAFLKTLEEPPARSILILLTTEPQRVLETILSRCLRLTFAGEGARASPADLAWLKIFAETVAREQKSLLGRYRVLGRLMQQLSNEKEAVETTLSARSPLERYEDIEPKVREKWENELKAAIEAEYRRRRAELLRVVQWWLRDVWLETMNLAGDTAAFPELAGETRTVAGRVSPEDAMANLQVLEGVQRLLHTNIQESLALEVSLLKLKL